MDNVTLSKREDANTDEGLLNIVEKATRANAADLRVVLRDGVVTIEGKCWNYTTFAAAQNVLLKMARRDKFPKAVINSMEVVDDGQNTNESNLDTVSTRFSFR